MAKLAPSLKPFKLNLVVRLLERNGTIVIDGDGYIVWSRGEKSQDHKLSEVADFSPEFREFLKKRD